MLHAEGTVGEELFCEVDDFGGKPAFGLVFIPDREVRSVSRMLVRFLDELAEDAELFNRVCKPVLEDRHGGRRSELTTLDGDERNVCIRDHGTCAFLFCPFVEGLLFGFGDFLEVFEELHLGGIISYFKLLSIKYRWPIVAYMLYT